MIKWIVEWWRFLVLAAAISAIAAIAKRFLENWIADSIITFVTLIGGANMIFDLIGRRTWEQRLAEKDREITDQAQVIASQAQEITAQAQEITAQAQEIATRDGELSAQGREIIDLRQRLEQLEQKLNGQSQNQSEQ